MSELIKRALSGIVYITLFIFCVWYSDISYIILISLFSIIGLYEFSKLTKYTGIAPYLLFPLFIIGFKNNIIPTNYLPIILGLTILGLLFLIFNLYRKNNTPYSNNYFKKLVLTTQYIILPFSFLILLPFFEQKYQPEIIMGIIILIWVNDSFAYLVGKKIGKNKLFKRISPKKTIEGFLGGVVFACLAALILSKFYTLLNATNWIVIALITSFFGTYGDLVESKFKRNANVKDSGTIMPGHGGILDRLDSLLFLAPFVYLYIHFII